MSAPVIPAASPLVGRDAEFAEASAFVADLVDTGGGAFLLRGEAGIGKSRLLAELAADCEAAGWQVLAASASNIESQLPYSVFLQLVRSTPSNQPPHVREQAARLVEQLDVTNDKPMVAAYGAATRYIDAMRRHGPTILVVDDLGHCDDDTAALLTTLLRRSAESPLVVVGTARVSMAQRGPMAALLDQLAESNRLRRLDLRPLGKQAVEALVAATLGSPPDERLVEAVARSTNGNPFFVTQVLLSLLEADAVAVEGGRSTLREPVAPMSPDRREVVLRRVLRVSEEARTVARAVALLGSLRSDRFSLVATLAQLDLAQVAKAIDGLVASQVLGEDDGTFRFSHQLLRDTLYQDIGAGTRWRWHQLVAEWLSTLPTTGEVALELAHHTGETAEVGDQQALEVIVRAGELMAESAPRSAVPWYHRALAIMPEDHPKRDWLLGRLARALLFAGRPHEAVDVGRSVLARAGSSADNARTTYLLVEALWEAGNLAEAQELVDLLTAVEPLPVRFVAQAANLFHVTGRYDDAFAAEARTRALLTEAPPVERVVAHCHLGLLWARDGWVSKAAAIWRELEEELADAPPSTQLGAYSVMSFQAALVGCIEPAEQFQARADVLLDEAKLLMFGNALATGRVLTASHVGDWDSALRLADDVIAGVDDEGHSPMQFDAVLAVAADIESNRGDWRRARHLLARYEPQSPATRAQWAWTMGGIELASGSASEARRLLEAELAEGTARPVAEVLLRARLAETLHAAGALDEARRVAEELAAVDVDDMSFPARTEALCVVGTVLADADRLTQAAALARRHRAPFVEARAQLALGDLGRERLDDLLVAHEAFHRLGAQPWRRRAASSLRRYGVPVPRFRAPKPSIFTETEAQIVRLVQEARSNREIAQTLSISLKTVESYLTRIYAKTGCATRLELARASDAGRFN
ncbi:MAG TPA: AAA family ATPase [Acidimicrobiales bacterium]|nr:AAA family ATPase [Acidimicrobiales bacterium]